MKTWLVVVFLAAFALALVSSEPSGWGGYFQYANVPGWGQYEFGYNRGNHDHFTSRFEQGWGWKFKTKVRWGDKKGGYGEMYYDYQHAPKKGWGHGHHHHHGKHHHHHGSGSQLASFSENIPTVLSPASSSGPSSPLLSSNPEPLISIPPPQSHYSTRRMARVLPQQPTQLVYRPQQQQPRVSRAYLQQQQQQQRPIPVYYNPYPMRY